LAFQAAQAQLRLTEAGFGALDQRRRQLEPAYSTGEIPLVELVRARVAAFDADLGRARARAAVYRARSRLNQALGVMP
jgi:outer membrane protein TolC